MIRIAKESDSNQILGIYQQYIHSTVTFEEQLPSELEFREKVEQIKISYPYIVYEENSTILGYCYVNTFRERSCYRWDVELSVYVDQNAQGKGIGKKLCETIIELTKLQNIRNIYSCITTPNVASESLHQALNFTKVGVFKQAGYKNGKLLDVTFYELNINQDVQEVLSFALCNHQMINQIIDRVNNDY